MPGKPIDIVADCGADPTGVIPADAAIVAAYSLAVAGGVGVHCPGTTSVFTLKGPLAVASTVPLTGDGGWIRRADNAQLPKPGSGNHLMTFRRGAGLVVRDIGFDGNSAHQLPTFVGNTVSIRQVTGVDLARMPTKNMRGLATFSTPTLAETFALELWRCADVTIDECSSHQDDGGPSATGIVSHFSTNVTIKNTAVCGVRGQGFGCFSAHGFRLYGCVAAHCGHGFNVEAGTEGTDGVIIGGRANPSYASACHAGIVVNGNYGQNTGTVTIDDTTVTNCYDGLLLTGLRAKAVNVTRLNIIAPSHAAINLGGKVGTLGRAKSLTLTDCTLTAFAGRNAVVGGVLAPGHGALTAV